MIHILETFAGGMSFASGAFIGTAVVAYTLRHANTRYQKQIIEANNKVEQRLHDQVEILRRIADHLDGGKK
jgi:hypothetical protein